MYNQNISSPFHFMLILLEVIRASGHFLMSSSQSPATGTEFSRRLWTLDPFLDASVTDVFTSSVATMKGSETTRCKCPVFVKQAVFNGGDDRFLKRPLGGQQFEKHRNQRVWDQQTCL